MARRGFDDGEEEVAPWLSAAEVEPDARHTHVAKSRLIWWIGLLVVLLLLVVGLIYASVARPDDDGEFTGADGQPGLISAPETPYRVRPKSAGGMDVEGVGQTAYEAADGVDPGGDLDLGALPEEPMERPVAAAPVVVATANVPHGPEVEAGDAASVRAPVGPPKAVLGGTVPKPVNVAPVAKSAAATAAKPPPAPPKSDRLAGLDKQIEAAAKPKASGPAPATSSSGGTVLQLGAFSSEGKAKAAWKNFAGRYGYLAGLEQAITPLERDGKTLYRLRATGAVSPGQAADLCARLKVAGEQCSVTE